MNKNLSSLAALVLLGVASIGLSACGDMVQGASADEAVQHFSVRAHDVGFDTHAIRARVGQPVAITYVNDGRMAHAFTVNGLAEEARVRPDETHVFTFTPTKPGDYRFFCAIAGHELAGMSGTLTVK